MELGNTLQKGTICISEQGSLNLVRKCYSQYYTSEVQRQLAARVEAQDGSVGIRLTVVDAKHANWIVEIHNKFQSDRSATIIKHDLI